MTLISTHESLVDSSRARLLQAIGQPRDLTFVRTPGNIGDELIHAGTRALLADLPHQEVPLAQSTRCHGDTLLLGGGGAWCGAYQHLPDRLKAFEERFARVIVLPSTYDPSIPVVRNALERSSAFFFAREEVSFRMIASLCRAELAHDCAFFFNFKPYQRSGAGTLTAFRTDQESAFAVVPPGNRDISATCIDLDEWLNTIADHDLVRTDRAHVTIAAALMGKRVEYAASNYHKVPALVDYGLRGFRVTRIQPEPAPTDVTNKTDLTDSARIKMLVREVSRLIPDGCRFIFVDQDQFGHLPFGNRVAAPFLERDGMYWGPPGEDAIAIQELERMRRAGAKFIVFPWRTFWWLEFYSGFDRHLRSCYRCIFQDPIMVVFELRRPSSEQTRD